MTATIRRGTRVRTPEGAGKVLQWVRWDRTYYKVLLDNGLERTYESSEVRRCKVHTDTGVVEILGPPTTALPGVGTCYACGRSWDNTVLTAWTPPPAARCPFEYDHDDESESA